ncbi:MAG: hypothetical protein CMP61_03995 [Flavobacteriales bacterium]|nr:hypothetical protein [Flavobacteriales bacterium]|tara:strand:- start:9405 stop:10520 length:1116 start_codon:yes stop_codon:yes gene_type:complete
MPIVGCIAAVFDLFHVGHIEFLKKCKSKCDFLIVGIHNDVTVEQYKRITIMNQDERKVVVDACKYVDRVITDMPLIIDEEFIMKNNIDVFLYATTSDEEDKQYNQKYFKFSREKLVKLPYTSGISTTELIVRCNTRSQMFKIPNIGQDPLRYILNNNILNDNGLVLEFGKFNGQSLDLISNYTTKDVFGFDVFTNLDTELGDDCSSIKTFKIDDIPETDAQLDRNKNVKFVKGTFEKTLKPFMESQEKNTVSFIHINRDCSAKYILNSLTSKIYNGCIIVFDKLVNYPNFEQHDWLAFHEFVHKHNVSFEWIGMNGKMLNRKEIFDIFSHYDNDDSIPQNKKLFSYFSGLNKLGIFISAAVRITNNPACKE